jgi:hypothetical protein
MCGRFARDDVRFRVTVTPSGRCFFNWLSTHFGGHDCEIFVTLLFESGYRHRINCSDAVQPERRSNGGNWTFGRHLPSEHHGAGAEASYQATKADAARGCPRYRTPHRVSWDIADHHNAVDWGRVSVGKASQAREGVQQLRRWLPIKLPVRQPSLGRMLRVCLSHAVRRVQKPATLQDLRCVHRDQLFPWLEAHGSLVVLQQPRIEQVENVDPGFDPRSELEILAMRWRISRVAGSASACAVALHATTFDFVSLWRFRDDASSIGCPRTSGDMTMKFSSRFFSNLAIAIASTAMMLFSLSGAAMALTEPSGSTSLPSITVEAPKQGIRPQRPMQRAVIRGTGRRTASHGTSPTTTTPSTGEGSVLERLRKLERESSSCPDGCQSSFPSGNRPWVGCSTSAFPMPSVGCRNTRHFKTYVACTETVYFLGYRQVEAWWYCSNLALK